MTKQMALDRILQEYPKGKDNQEFFKNLIDDFTGDSSYVDDYCFNQIRVYLHNMT